LAPFILSLGYITCQITGLAVAEGDDGGGWSVMDNRYRNESLACH